jgi:hypothetical protein
MKCVKLLLVVLLCKYWVDYVDQLKAKIQLL